MNENRRTVALAIASFRTASRFGRPLTDPIKLNAASAAGLLLLLFGTPRDALDALERLPDDETWLVARRHLGELVHAESRDTEPPQAEEREAG